MDSGYLRAEIGSDFGTVEGLRDSDQFLNFRLTPKRNLIRNGFYFNTNLYYKTKTLKYIGSKNELPLVVDGIVELDGDYSHASSGSQKPVFCEFDTILTPALEYFLENEPNTLITVTYNGATITGFLENATINFYKRTAKIKMSL
jgi:hypothetical protein